MGSSPASYVRSLPPSLSFALSCQIETSGAEKMLVFFKLRPAVITEENLHQSILVSSMLDSPINTLYQAVRQVFAPALLKARLSVCFSVILP